MNRYPLVRQIDSKDCGPACVGTILKHYGSSLSLNNLQELCKTNYSGTTAYNLVKAFENLGFISEGLEINLDYMRNLKLPLIAHITIDKSLLHYIVVYKVNYKKKYLIIADPKDKVKRISFDLFLKCWNHIVITATPYKPIIYFNNEHYILKKIISFFLHHNKTQLSIFILSMINIIFTLLISFSLQYIFIGVSNYNSLEFFTIGFIVFVILILFKSLSNFLKNMLLLKFDNQLDDDLTNEIVKTIIYLPYRYYCNHPTGEIIGRINDLDKVKNFINKSILLIHLDIPLILCITVILFYLNTFLALLSLAIILIYVLLVIIFKPKYDGYIKDLYCKKDYTNTFLVEHLKAYETLKGLNIETNSTLEFKNIYDDYLKTKLRFTGFYNLEVLFKDLLYSLGPLTILFSGSFLILNGQLSLGVLITINILVTSYLLSFRNIVDLYVDYKEANISLYRIDNLLFKDSNSKEKKITNNGHITLNNLSYRSLKNISLDIKKGSKIMLIGKSGCGKTTICQLLKQYYKPQDDMIYIDGNDINKTDDFKGNITYVSQDEKVFSTTLYDNLTLNRKINNNELYDVIKMCEIDKFIDRNLGLNMLIEEDGFNLSGGQKQQIVLARSLINSCKILIIDEALNQMDTDLEKRILKRIIKKFSNTTFIFITHHVSNENLFDQVIFLDKRKVVE